MSEAPKKQLTRYTRKLGEALCARLAEGITLKITCVEFNVAQRTVYEWRRKHPEFDHDYEIAREQAATVFADLIAEVVEETTEDNAKASDVKVRGLTWLASRLDRRRFGDKQEIALTGALSTVAVPFDPQDLPDDLRIAFQEILLLSARSGRQSQRVIEHEGAEDE